MRHLQIYTLLVIFTFLSFKSSSQYLISYPEAASDLTVCQSSQAIRIRVDILATTSNDTVAITFPPGITMNTGFINVISSNGLTLTLGSTAGNVSKFSLGTGTHTAGQFIDFKVSQNAGCIARDSSLNGANFKNNITVYGSAGSVSETNPSTNSYNVKYPSIVMTSPTAISNATVGSNYIRNFTITNGSATCTNILRFYLVYPNAVNSLNSISFNGNIQTPVSTSGDTLFFAISGTSLSANGLLCNGQSVNIVENVKVLKTCNNITSYGSSWGCGIPVSTWCQQEQKTAIITPAAGSPNYTSYTTSIVNFINKCSPITASHRFTNGGTGDPTQAGMYNISLSLGQGPYAITQGGLASGISYSNFTIGGNSVPINIVGSFAQGSLNNYFNFDPDGPGGLADLDGDGFFDDLPGGQSLTLNATLNFNCTGNLTCGSNEMQMWVQNGKLTYQNICGELLTPENKWSSGYNHYEWAFTATGYVPANIVGGTPFQATMDAGWYINISAFNTANTVYRWTLTLPAGVSVASPANPLYGGVATTYTQVGNVVTITSPNATFAAAKINLVYTCGAGGSVNIPYTLDKINDIVAGCFCDARLVCGTFTMNVSCPTSCPAGVSNYIPKVRRSDFALGWTTTAMTTKQNAASISAYDLSKALYLDTILITMKGKQNGAATNMHLELELDKTSGGVDKLSPVSVAVSVYRAGVLVNQATITASSSIYSTATVQSIDWNISTAFPTGIFANDSVVTVSKYVVSTNSGLPQSDVQSGKWMRLYNLAGATKLWCGNFVPEMFLVGTYAINGTNPYQASGCTSVTLGGGSNYIARRFNSSGSYYQNEYRPVIYIDSFDITLNNNYTLENVTFTTWQGVNGTLIIPTALPGNVYRFKNTGSIPALFLTVENTYGGNILTTVKATCSTDGTEIINRKFYTKDYYYAHQGLPTPAIHKTTFGAGSANLVNNPAGFSTGIGYSTSSKPNIDIINQTGTVNAYTNALSWNIRVNSVGANTAPYVWFAIPSNAGILVSSVVDAATNTPITGTAYPGGRIYQVSTAGIPSGTSRDYVINATLANCNTDSLKLYSGWNCGSYPTSPSLYTCSKDSLYLKVIPQNTSTQIAFTTTPSNPVSACTPLNYQARIQNAGGANFRNTRFIVTVPNGLTMGTLQAEYPSGSGVWTTLSASISGTNYTYDVSSLTAYPVLGIPGTVQATSNSQREINVRWTFTVTCNFASGSSFQIRTRSDNPCGSLVQGSNVPIYSSTISINGVTSPYALATATTVSSPNINCNSVTTITAQSTVVGGSTSSNATLNITLPAGFTYVPGSISTSGPNPPTFTSTSTSGGIQTVRFNLPSGVTSGNTINYSFQISGSVGTGCGTLPIVFQSYEQTATIPCSTAPTGFCATSQVQTEYYSTNINLMKPNLVVTASTSYQNAYNSAQFFTFYTLQNQGTTALPSTNPFTVNYYCANGSGNPTGGIIASSIHTANIPVNGSMSFSDTLPNPCGYLQNFVAVISNSTNCICNQVQQLFSPIVNLGIDLVYLDVEKTSERSAKIKWQTNTETNTDFYSVERSNDMLSWINIGTVAAAGNSESLINYSYNDNEVSSGIYYYRLKQFDINGEFTTYGPQSIIFGGNNSILAIPNPSNTGIFTISGASEKGEISIFDSKGLLISYGSLSSSSVIDLSRFDAGIYVAHIVDENNLSTLRLVKK